MSKTVQFTVNFLLLSISLLNAQSRLVDGPYILINEQGYEQLNVEIGPADTAVFFADKILSNHVELNDGDIPFVVVLDSLFPFPSPSAFKNVRSIAAVSDVHGQFALFKNLLQAHGIINEYLEWSYGQGHLVITGDVFDRGDKVTETLWLIYKLEHEAKLAGGEVHFLLGNHEIMVLQDDLRYIHPKYLKTSSLCNISYAQLFGINTVLGRWLRSKPITISINDILFVHGGISPLVASYTNSMDTINDKFLNNLIDGDLDVALNDTLLNILYLSEGPVWYRGYFDTELMNKDLIKTILKIFDKKAVVVGHTSFTSIQKLFDDRVYGIDSNIKMGNTGEILLIEKNRFYRGLPDGSKERL